MKILEINAYYNFGSTGHIVKDLCEEGSQKGHEMYAIYWLLHDPQNNSGRIIFCGEKKEPSIFYKIIQWVFNGGKLNYNIERTQKIIEQIENIKPDIIHLHNLHGDFEYGSLDVDLFFSYLAKRDYKVVWTFHDCWPITGRCYYFSYKKCEKWKTGCGSCPQRIYDRQGVFYDHSNANWDRKNRLYQKINNLTIVTVSDWLRSIIKESMLKDRPIVTIYNGVDTNIFIPRNEKVKSKYRVLCIGWERRKGYKDYYRLAKILSEDAEIIVVGKKPAFRRLHNTPKNMIEVDCISSRESMAEIYRTSDAYFNASPAETFGLTTVESMSCGTPVVGYKNTATKELIEKVPGGGILVEEGAVWEVKKALTILKENNIDRAKMHDICNKMFNYSNMINNYMDLYSDINPEKVFR